MSPAPDQPPPARAAARLRRNLAWASRNLLGGVAVLWAAASFAFLIQTLLPGDRALIIINIASGNLTNPTQAEIDLVNAQYGFSDPLIVQYARYMLGLLQGDFGVSYQQHVPVLRIIAAQIGPTIELSFAALGIAWVIAIGLTVLTAGRDGPVSRGAANLQIVMATLPPYWIGTIMLVLFAVTLRLFPVEGSGTLIGLVLPAVSLAIPLAGFIGEVIQAEFTRVLEQPFVTSSRTRGMSDLGVRLRHVLRHAILPGVTLSGWAIGKLFSGAVLVEAVFARPGLGGVLVTATSARDIPVVTGIVVLSAAIFVVANLLVDRAYLVIDPRIKLA
ncbi:ABC transporter permease [Rhodovastum atsumiense]|uniref:ABC transporter permease n=1 Tax=Rhodovastum atsumiense TaxID=504468 RepID=A0A5M6INN7_9PROT|nr:ABC transporter permease [Rhodovastum atsumiense]KAA5609886.1 ABC transporter permease [Rhodovastum atsumiense]CAH2602413.1 ABC transporter permease [Rhodovastum atsumiense]